MDGFEEVRQIRHGVAWPELARLLRRKDTIQPRVTYLDGVLELVTAGYDHERIKSYLGCLIELYALERDVELTAIGSWTQTTKVRRAAAEPDECYQVGTTTRHRRPDFVIEVDWSQPRVDKLKVYRRLGVHEVWLWRRGRLEVHVLRGRSWHRVDRSPSLPELDLDLLLSFLDRPSLTAAQRDFREALRTTG